jgi:hypothetical protein
MALFIIFALGSPYFDLKRITVTRDSANLDVSKIELALKDFYGRNLLFFPEEELQEILKQNFPEFQAVALREKWPDTLELKIKISPPIYNLLNTETANFSLISREGIILSLQSEEFLPVIKVYQHEAPIILRESFTTLENLEKIEQIQLLFQEF